MVLTIADVPMTAVESLLARYGLAIQVQPDGADITGSFWGDSEAGVVGCAVYVRGDTPVHSLLHETCHIICMDEERRSDLETDAGGDDLEEAAVCYLQVMLADYIDGVGRDRLMRDMDEWGYSFRLGDTRSWFERDAEDARKWLIERELLAANDEPRFRLRA
jgi:hypothetical protein